MCVGLGLALFALLVATIALCCECKRCNSSHAVAVLLLLACEYIIIIIIIIIIKNHW